ncbi:amidohydrolase family protein [Frankia gtarii]|uniref:amidohydrolase family protein n=1 Tax=Frankia gtarii TaxID=2950102 RepID=UPI0021C0371B|nr:amidohydrolase [Frankia gtarii]
MDVAALPKISSDAHVDEPHDLWYERLPESLRDRAPRRILGNAEGGWTLVVNGDTVGWGGLTEDEARKMEENRLAAITPEVRLEMMRTDNLRGEVIYPTIGLYVWSVQSAEVGEASVRIYNDWVLERLGGNPRIKLAGMIPTWNVENAIAEVRRLAPHPSIAGLLLPLVGTPDWNMPQWEPLWAAIAETGKPALMHQGTGHDMMFYRGWGSPTANVLATQSMAPRAAALLSCGGVFERYPDLHVVMVEVNTGWVAWAMSTLDEYYEAHRGWSKPKLAEMPSAYLRRQLHTTFQDDPVGIHNLSITGRNVPLWGNDYPHPEGIFPNSDKILKVLLNGVSYEDAVAVTSGNAMRLFKFSQDVLDSAP